MRGRSKAGSPTSQRYPCSNRCFRSHRRCEGTANVSKRRLAANQCALCLSGVHARRRLLDADANRRSGYCRQNQRARAGKAGIRQGQAGRKERISAGAKQTQCVFDESRQPHARDQIEIELRYTELLVPTDGVYEVVFPTVVGPRYSSQPESSAPQADQWVKSPYLHQGEKPSSALHISTRISAGVPIQDLSCASHQIFPQWQSPTIAQLVLDDADPFQGNRDFILRYRLAGEQIASGLLLYQGEDENFFLYMAQPPERVTNAEIPAREYIFVVDVSGSMDGFPLNTSKRLLRDLIGQLRPTDLFNVVLFAGDSAALSQSRFGRIRKTSLRRFV